MRKKKRAAGFHDFVVGDLLADIPGISSRAMFGGWSVYKAGVIFAIIADDRIYFKVDDTNRTDYERYDSRPFVYAQGNHKPTTMSYWELPEEISEDREQLCVFVQRAVEASLRAKRRK